jgi:lactate dehydrogenase-like 2-hydroxyacid dehydrogenase
MTLLYHGPNRRPEAEASLGVQYRGSLQELLAESDIVSLHGPLTSVSRHLLNAETLVQMKPGAVLVNTGRGPLVDEKAVLKM